MPFDSHPRRRCSRALDPACGTFTPKASAVLLAVSVLSVLAAVALGDIPKKINYQGKLIDSSSLPLAGSHSILFSIYAAADGGSPLWSETKTTEADSNGVFSTVLGSVNPVDVLFTSPRWLEIQVDGETLSPRREIASVPFAYHAGTAGQADHADEASNATMLAGRPAEAYADSSVDGHSLDAADGSPKDAVDVANAGRVGIATASPNGPLHVESGISINNAGATNFANRIAPAVGGGNVGIGTTDPDAKLEVDGQVKITGGSPGAGKVFSSDAGGLASWQAMDVEYMVNPADNALARLSSNISQGYYEGYYLMFAHEAPLSASLAIPIHVQSRVGGVTQKIESIKVYYRACTGNKIDAIRIQMMGDAGGDISVINDTTDRTSTTWTSYTVTDPSPNHIAGVVAVWLDSDFEDSGSFDFQSIVMTTGP